MESENRRSAGLGFKRRALDVLRSTFKHGDRKPSLSLSKASDDSLVFIAVELNKKDPTKYTPDVKIPPTLSPSESIELLNKISAIKIENVNVRRVEKKQAILDSCSFSGFLTVTSDPNTKRNSMTLFHVVDCSAEDALVYIRLEALRRKFRLMSSLHNTIT